MARPLLFVAFLASLVAVNAFPSFAASPNAQRGPAARGVYVPPGPGDARSPCPGLNTLANHNYINHNGRNIAWTDLLQAASDAYNLDPAVTGIAAINAQIIANIFPNGVMSALSDLNRTHNVIEHDASLSRSDYNLGDYVRVNSTLVAQFLPNTNAILTRSDIAAARRRRINDSRARNPSFTWRITAQEPVSAAESSFLHLIFGTDGKIPASYLKFFLLNEQLPTSLGWQRSSSTIDLIDLTAVSAYYLAQEIAAFGVSPREAAKIAHGAIRKHIERAMN